MRQWTVQVREVPGGFEADVVGIGGAFSPTVEGLMDHLRRMLVEYERNSR